MQAIETIYRQLRNQEWRAEEAFRAAKIRVQFEEKEEQGLVKLEAEPDCNTFIEDYCDSDDPKEKEKIIRQINREGVWVLCVYARATDDDGWEFVDCVGGFIGDSFKNSGYDDDLMKSGLEALDNMMQTMADDLAARATFAG